MLKMKHLFYLEKVNISNLMSSSAASTTSTPSSSSTTSSHSTSPLNRTTARILALCSANNVDLPQSSALSSGNVTTGHTPIASPLSSLPSESAPSDSDSQLVSSLSLNTVSNSDTDFFDELPTLPSFDTLALPGSDQPALPDADELPALPCFDQPDYLV